MIGRLWHGRTRPENADAYERLLRTTVLPGIHRIAGYKCTYLLRRPAEKEVEFVTITLRKSMEAVRAFAGPEGKTAVVPPDVRKLLARFDDAPVHYDAIWRP